MKLTIKCPCCSGTGEAPLPDKLREVVVVVNRLGTCTVPMIFHHLDDKELTITSCNKKVSRLLKMGILKRINPEKKVITVELAE